MAKGVAHREYENKKKMTTLNNFSVDVSMIDVEDKVECEIPKR